MPLLIYSFHKLVIFVRLWMLCYRISNQGLRKDIMQERWMSLKDEMERIQEIKKEIAKRQGAELAKSYVSKTVAPIKPGGRYLTNLL